MIEIGLKGQTKMTGAVKGMLAAGEKRPKKNSLPLNSAKTIAAASKRISDAGDSEGGQPRSPQ